MIKIKDFIKDNSLRIIVKTNAPRNDIISYDKERKALRVNIKVVPEKNKANKEIIKFFSKILKKKVSIVSGLKSREKVLKIC